MLVNVLELGGELVSVDEATLHDSIPTRVMFRHVRNAVNQYRQTMTIARQRSGDAGRRARAPTQVDRSSMATE